MSYELPMGVTINDCLVLHDGSHDSRGIPHEQYISKWNYATTINNGSVTGKHAKICEINYEQDNNTILNYIIKIISEKSGTSWNINVSVGGDGVITFNCPTNSTFALTGVFSITSAISGSKKTAKLILYAQLYKAYNPIYIMVEFARNTENNTYPRDYAFKSIEIINNEALIDAITPTHTPIDISANEFTGSLTWGSVSVLANSTTTISVTDGTIKWNSIVNYSTSVPLPEDRKSVV